MTRLFDNKALSSRKSQNRRSEVYRTLKQAILDGEIERGTWLQEDQVCQVLKASRTPIREAFNRLKGEGLLEIIPRKGARVIDLSSAQIDSLYEARANLELTYFDKSIRSLKPQDYEQLKEELCAIESKLLDSEQYSEEWDHYRKEFSAIDRAFHDRLILACGNEYWVKIYFQIRDLIIISSIGRSFTHESVMGVIMEHRQILDALIEKDYSKARDLLADHIMNTRRYEDVNDHRQRVVQTYKTRE